MSVASASRTVKYIAKSGTWTSWIMSTTGDLCQEYQGDAANPSSIYPNYESMDDNSKPVLLLVCTSSRSSSVSNPDSVDFYLGNAPITFGSNGKSTGTFANYFEKIEPTPGGYDYYGIRILKNLVNIGGGNTAVVFRMVGHFNSSGASSAFDIEASYLVSILKAQGERYNVTIAAGDENYFVFKEKEDTVKLKAIVRKGTQIISPSTLMYKWYKQGPIIASEIDNTSGVGSDLITLNSSDINNANDIIVEVYSADGNTFIGMDTQTVVDASDPYEILPNPNPADETIVEGDSNRNQVTYTPTLVKRYTQAQISGARFNYYVYSAVGTSVIHGSISAGGSFSITATHCAQNGGDLGVIIEAINSNI